MLVERLLEKELAGAQIEAYETRVKLSNAKNAYATTRGALLLLTPFLGLNGVWLSALVACTASAMFTILLYVTLKYNKKE